MSRFVHFTFESTKGGFNWFSFAYFNFDGDSELSGGCCSMFMKFIGEVLYDSGEKREKGKQKLRYLSRGETSHEYNNTHLWWIDGRALFHMMM